MVPTSHVKHFKNGDAFYKVNHELKRITKIENNTVEYLDYEQHVAEVTSYKKTRPENWKNVENTFFISKDFQWEWDGKKFTTTNKPIEWIGTGYDRKAIVFHNGKIWEAAWQGQYYPQINLTRIERPFKQNIVEAKQLVEDAVANMPNSEAAQVTEAGKEQATLTLSIELMRQSQKWTNIKYIRHFEEII